MTDNKTVELTKEETKTTEEVIKKLFSELEIEGTFEISQNEDTLEILMDTKDSGMVIGYHGEVLESLQLVTSLVVAKELGKFIRVSIEVDGYKKSRTEYLERVAHDAKERAVTENNEQVISSLKSWERRIVHLMLQEDPDVVTESAGEGRDRVLIVKPK